MITFKVLSQHQTCTNPHHKSLLRNNPLLPPPNSTALKYISNQKCRHSFVLHCTQKPLEHEPDNNNKPSKTPDGLYASIKNQRIREFLEMVGYGSQILRCDPFTLFVMQSLLKKQGTALLASLMAFIAHHLELVIIPTTTGEGPDIGFRWVFEWKNDSIPLGPVCSLYTYHLYSGKILVRNGKSLIQQPMIKLELLKRKINDTVMSIWEKILQQRVFERKKSAALFSGFLAIFFIVITQILWKNSVV